MKKIINFIDWPMNVLGLSPLKQYKILHCNICFLLNLVIIAYGMYGTILFTYHANNDFYNFVVPMAFSISLVSIIVIVLSFQIYRPKIHEVLSRIEDNVFVYPDEDDLDPKYEAYLSEENYYKVCALVLSLQMFGFTIPTVSPFIVYFLVGSLPTLPLPQWTHWRVDSTLRYVLTFLHQVVIGIVVLLNFYMIQIYFTFILVEFLRQYKKLQHAVETLNQRSHEKLLADNVGKYSTNADTANQRRKFDCIYRFNLIMCICHHQELCKLFKSFKNIYEIAYSLELMGFTFSFSLLLYCLVEKNDPARRLGLVGVAWEMVLNAFLKCVIGEKFSEMNSRIQYALFYKTQWYDHSLENRKLISTLHLATKNPLTLKGFKMFEASYYVFSYIIRSSYSYLNLIRAS